MDGHYPEFPIVPGAILVELAVEAAFRAAPAAADTCTRLSVESARFLAPVRPHDIVSFTTDVRAGEDGDTVVRVTGKLADETLCCRTRIRISKTKAVL
ncbi:hypothetical protein ACFVMC_28120 [Nocardia sp. NPDC127579]|uniref:hypothetical protein n=1 Tax=Nocardia sp. NPDC127579 TaxID=3345402 RepID=UPI003625C35F